MSRCFPFPPPGYDLKARPDDVNLIIKDKQKHKKHKEKKDKDRKERKENKEKERSVDKHEDDKKRKRKEHREKKDKSKDEQNGEIKNVGSFVNPVDGNHDKRAVVELANRVRSKDGATGNHMVQKITVLEKENVNSLGKVLENSNGMLAANVQSLAIDSRSLGNGLFKAEGSPWQMDTVEKRTEGREMNRHRNNAVEGDGRKNEDKTNNLKAEDKIMEKTKRENVNSLGKVLENGNGMLAANVRSLTIDSRSLGNELFKAEGIPWQMDAVEKRKEGREMNGHRNNAVEGDGRKNEDKNNNLKAEDKNKEKTKKETGFAKQETSDRNIRDFHSNQDCQGKLSKLEELNGFLHANGVRSDNKSRHVISSHRAGETGSGLRCFIADEKANAKISSPQSVIDHPLTASNAKRMVKKIVNPSADRKFPSSHSFVENGVKMAMQAPDAVHKMMHNKELISSLEGKNNSSLMLIVNPSADGKFPSSHSFVEKGVKMAMQGPDVVHKMMHNKELRTNSSLEGKNSSSSVLSSASLKRKEKVATTTKPPHPDLKYLSKILTVPEFADLPPCDDQEWLFGHEDSQTKRPKLASPEIQSTKEVWSKAVILESTGTIALPYVIPY